MAWGSRSENLWWGNGLNRVSYNDFWTWTVPVYHKCSFPPYFNEWWNSLSWSTSMLQKRVRSRVYMLRAIHTTWVSWWTSCMAKRITKVTHMPTGHRCTARRACNHLADRRAPGHLWPAWCCEIKHLEFHILITTYICVALRDCEHRLTSLPSLRSLQDLVLEYCM